VKTEAWRASFGRWWYDRRTRSLLLQLATAAAIVAGVAWIVETTATHLAERNMSAGFGFLRQHAGFVIGETLIPFDAQDSYLRAMLVCALNTVLVSLLACAAATILGVVIGLGRLAPNPVLHRLASLYVLLFRNTPLLLQMILWYALLQTLPPMRQARSLADTIFLSQRGLRLPALDIQPAVLLAIVAAVAAAALLLWRTGARWWFPVAIASLLVAAAALSGHIGVDYPVRRGFNFAGGLEMTPEFTALFAGLMLYYAAYIAEIVRGGILAVPAGQWEAAHALGLSTWRVMRHVVVPQALRVITPPLTMEYVGIIKSSSLGILVGYPELFWSVSTMIGQTGHAIEGITLLMLAYLVPSLGAAAGMNALNRRLLRTTAA
jgi:general L-amino acid transport system permease protein